MPFGNPMPMPLLLNQPQQPQQSQQLVKAKLKVVPNDPLSDPSAKDVEFMFNPQEISFTRNSIWDPVNGSRGYDGLPKVNFGRLDPYTFSFSKLMFDTYETRGQTPKSKTKLMDIIENIKKGVSTPDDATKRPPVYIFSWGSTEYFYCVMTKLTYTLTMFLNDGTPVRALVDIDLLQVDAKNMPGGAQSASTGTGRTSPTLPNPTKPNLPTNFTPPGTSTTPSTGGQAGTSGQASTGSQAGT